MIITCIAHAMFRLELDCGLTIVTDPVDAGSGYPVRPGSADAVLVSHHHHDHDALDAVTGCRQVIDRTCERLDLGGAKLTAIQGWHDDVQGAKRGSTLLFLLEAEGLRIVHLGDLGTLPDEKQIAALAPADVLMVPVGGFYTIDAAQAKETARLLNARVILPMHYRTKYNPDWPIADAAAFTSLYPEDRVSRQPLMRVTAGDLAVQPPVCLLAPTLGAGF